MNCKSDTFFKYYKNLIQSLFNVNNREIQEKIWNHFSRQIYFEGHFFVYVIMGKNK